MSNLTEENRKAWDARASTYDTEPYLQKINAQITEALQSHVDWIGAKWAPASTHAAAQKQDEAGDEDTAGASSCSLLDYACGTGNVTWALKDHITVARGIDISESMLKVYSARTAAIPHITASAVLGDLVAPEARPGLDDEVYRDFDLAAVSGGFHHFEDPELCLRRLAERVKPETGVVLILDFLSHGFDGEGHEHGHGHDHDKGQDHNYGHGHVHAHGHNDSVGDAHKTGADWEAVRKTIKHHGFSEEAMKNMFEATGLVDFAFEVLDAEFVFRPNGRKMARRAFLARGRRAA